MGGGDDDGKTMYGYLLFTDYPRVSDCVCPYSAPPIEFWRHHLVVHEHE